MQVQVLLDVFAAAKATGFGADRHRLVAIDAEVGEDELRPVLAQVAEEQQAQTIAQLADLQAVQVVIERWAPGGKGLRGQVQREELLQHCGFLLRGAPVRQRQLRQQLVLAQQGGDLDRLQRCLLAEPAAVDQRLGGRLDIADLGVLQLAGAEVAALAHDHAHQQRLRRPGQLGELRDEGEFLVAEQVGRALADPGQGRAEVAEVIEFGGQGRGHGGMLCTSIQHCQGCVSDCSASGACAYVVTQPGLRRDGAEGIVCTRAK
ncbi:hypothetical protein D3C80_1044740 [compost metagenome]